MDTSTWAHRHFWGAALGDLRLLRRLVEVASCIRRNPRGTLPQAINDGMALKAAYRLLGNPKVTHEGILKPHVSATREQCREPGEYLLIEDTTALSFTQRGAIPGMGPLTCDTSQGLLVHTNLAARITQWGNEHEPQVVLVGVFGQQAWARTEPEGTRAERKRVKRIEKRTKGKTGESWRWGRAMAEAGAPPEGARWTLVSDRESDIFEVLEQCNAAYKPGLGDPRCAGSTHHIGGWQCIRDGGPCSRAGAVHAGFARPSRCCRTKSAGRSTGGENRDRAAARLARTPCPPVD